MLPESHRQTEEIASTKVREPGGSKNAPADAIQRAPRVAFAALHHPPFRLYFITTLLSMMADNIEHVISYWVIFQVFHSPALAGFAVLTHWMPFLLFSVYFGALADRTDCRRIIQIAQIMYMGVSFAWGVLFFTNTMQIWHAMVLLVVHGMAGVLWGPASQLLIHDIVGSEHLQSAVRLSSTSRQLGVLFGPAVGGALMIALGPPGGLFANVLIYIPLTIWLIKTPYTGHRLHQTATGRRTTTGFREALHLLRELSTDHVILSMIVLAGCASFFVGNAFQAQMPEYAHDLGTDKAGVAYSVLLGAYAGGAVVGGILLEGKGLLQPAPRNAMISAILWCLVIAGFAAATNYHLALVLLFIAGVLNLTFYSMAQTLVQLRAPSQLRGRVIGLFNMSSMGLRAFSGVTVGVLGSLIGIHWSLALSATALMAVTTALLAFSLRVDQS